MIFPYIVAAVIMSFCILTIVMQAKKAWGIKFLMKSLASFSFLTLGLVAFFYLKDVEKWHILVAIGLALGMMGDIFLATKGVVLEKIVQPMLLAGLLFFLLGHVAYISVYIILIDTFNYWTLIIAVFFPILMFLLMQTGKIRVKKEKIPILVYSLVLGGMLMLAVNLLLCDGVSIRNLLFLVGAILFSLSDFLLALYNFGGEKVKESNLVTVFYMPSYYIAQTLFALAIIF